MMFMNSNYGYASFAKGAMGQTASANSRAGKVPAKASKNPAWGGLRNNTTPANNVRPNTNPSWGGLRNNPAAPAASSVVPSSASQPAPASKKNRPKRQARALSQKAAAPTQRFGLERSARSSAAGMNQGMRDLPRKGRSAKAGGTQLLREAGQWASKNKLGVGLAGAGALGAVGYGVYRKMRSDKGKKRGGYN